MKTYTFRKKEYTHFWSQQYSNSDDWISEPGDNFAYRYVDEELTLPEALLHENESVREQAEEILKEQQ